jgi:hypothetical protein
MINSDLTRWHAEGDGSIAPNADDSFTMHVGSPYTLWYPESIDGDARYCFDCAVDTPNSAMLFFACARNWQGDGFFASPRSGHYEDYSINALESYTIGFNRASHVTNECQPNASTANVRRIGGAANHQKYPAAKLRPGGEINLPLWREWNRTSNLASAREHDSGLDQFFHYEFVFVAPYIRLFVEGEELLTVIDHKADPLQGGYFGIRNMTPGATCRLRNFSVAAAGDDDL